MKVLAVPNWSFFDPELCDRALGQFLPELTVHYVQGDVDHQRTVTAFSGPAPEVFRQMDELCRLFLDYIDLGKGGVHPFSGALDVAPFVLLDGSESKLIGEVKEWAKEFSGTWSIPVHMYEKAALPGAESRLPVLRGQLGPVTKPFDFGTASHSWWGYSVIGAREFLLAVNFNFGAPDLTRVRELAKEIRRIRESGEAEWAGVRVLAFHLQKQEIAQLSFNLTQPNRTSIDYIHSWVSDQIASNFETELIGVIRDVDLPNSTCLVPEPSQIVPTL
ncbi:MAG: hypothetical protein WCK51_01125 [Armatimonadota bacterium]